MHRLQSRSTKALCGLAQSTIEAMTFLGAATKVLADHGSPLSARELWEKIEALGLVETTGKTPERSLSTQLRRHALGSTLRTAASTPTLYKAGSAKFGLLAWLSEEEKQECVQREGKRNLQRTNKSTEWRSVLWSLIELYAEETNGSPEFRMNWPNRPDLEVRVIIVNGQPRVQVTDSLRQHVEDLSEDEMFARLPGAKQRKWWKKRAENILNPRTKTVSLLQAFSAALLPHAAPERTTISLNVYVRPSVNLGDFKKVLPPKQAALLEASGFNEPCSLTKIGSVLNIRPADGLEADDEDEVLDDLETPQWEGHHNVIVFGPPGTGKSYSVQKTVTTELQAETFRMTFHPETTYHDFVGTYRPTVGWLESHEKFTDADRKSSNREPRVYYRFEPGPFSRALVAAAKQPDKNVALIIEEINRGNCAAIFGDVFQLLDRASESQDEYGLSDYAITPISEWAEWLNSELPSDIDAWDGDSLRLPRNLYLFATMNTSDQGLFPMDAAFRRRWGMEYKSVAAPSTLSTRVPLFKDDKEGVLWREFSVPLNEEIVSYKGSDDKQLGPYFIRPRPGSSLVSPSDFASKVLFYLWSEVFRDAPNRVFVDGITTYDGLVKRYESGKEIFRPEITGLDEEELVDVPEELAPQS